MVVCCAENGKETVVLQAQHQSCACCFAGGVYRGEVVGNMFLYYVDLMSDRTVGKEKRKVCTALVQGGNF